jgi:hypothetical protein
VARKGLNRETPVPRQGKVFIVGPAFLLGRAGRWCLFKGTRRSSLRTILETVYPYIRKAIRRSRHTGNLHCDVKSDMLRPPIGRFPFRD